MTAAHSELTAEQIDEFNQLCAEYKAATLATCKALSTVTPPDPGRVLELFKAEAEAAAVFKRIELILRRS
jgi:hypothetical protein